MEEIKLAPLFEGIPLEKAISETFVSFPKPAFLENIAIDDAGNLFVTSLDEGVVYKITADRQKAKYAEIRGKLAGIVHIGGDHFLCNGWNEKGIPTIYLSTGYQLVIPLLCPEGAMFLNGIAVVGDGTFLICDSYKGVIWVYDLLTNKADIWLEHPLLARTNPSSNMPAANGIKIYANAVFVSNTDRKFLIRIPLLDRTAGSPEIHLDKVNLDDFAIDEKGNIYSSTHIYNSVVKITPGKRVSLVADASNGVTGSTSVIFGRTAADQNCLYVTTNGGLSAPTSGRLEDGKIIKLTLN